MSRTTLETSTDPMIEHRGGETPHTAGVPNFFYIGTSKAGSTWIYNLLCHHPRVYMAAGKGLYFFDSHFERGLEWYLGHFQPGPDKLVVGEVSHSYLYSPLACRRIAQVSPRAKLMVCLREPADRAFSAYLDAVKNGQFEGTFEQALDDIPSLVDRGRYATHLAPYIEQFGRERIHVGVFDELERDPARFAAALLAFLEVDGLELSDKLGQKVMPAAQPRARWLAALAKQGSWVLKRLGWRTLRGRIKRSRAVRNLLYRPFSSEDRPRMTPATRTMLRDRFRDEVRRLDDLVGTDLHNLWGYGSDPEAKPTHEPLNTM